MLIVDDKINSDLEDVFKEYNWPHKPVRVFAYSIAGSKSKESELKTIACSNKGAYRLGCSHLCALVDRFRRLRRTSTNLTLRAANFLLRPGYYEHVRRPEEIGEKVLNYLLVMARPLVMYENDHLIHWSSVYVDRKVIIEKTVDRIFSTK